MGAVYFGLDINLVGFFRNHLPLKSLVETGTFHGDTLSALVDEFETLYSVEISRELYEGASERFSLQEKIELTCGNSPEFLAAHRHKWQDAGTLYWLDAHWCDSTDGEAGKAQCPLLDELRSIGSLPGDSLIVIDDARLFLCAPPGGHDVGQWPDLDSVLSLLKDLSSDHDLAVVNDTMVYYPRRLKPEFTAFCRRNGRDILSAWDKSRNYDQLLRQLREKDELIERQAGQLAEKDALIETVRGEIEEKENCIRGQEGQLQEKEAAIEAMGREMEEKESCIRGQGRQLEEKEALIHDQADRLAGKDSATRAMEEGREEA